jgi:hypothetical protein
VSTSLASSGEQCFDFADIFEPNLRDFSRSPPFRLRIANGSAVVAPFARGVDRERWFVARARIVNLHPLEERRVEQNR